MSLAAAVRSGLGTLEPAPAKINLALHVTGRRADGYHELETLAVFTRLGDRVTVAADVADSFAMHGPFAASVPASADNLVLRARDAFFRGFGGQRPLRITLEKNLPVASGIGGGSSDAAAALRALKRVLRPETTATDLAALGLTLGADLPMCLDARPLVARGIGEALAPLGAVPPLSLVLVNPGTPVATPAVFKALVRRQNPPLPPLPQKRDAAALLAWLGATRNDLQEPALTVAPSIGAVLAALEQAGALFARMSGSGATCFGLFPGMNDAQSTAAAIRRAQPGWWVEATATLPSEAPA